VHFHEHLGWAGARAIADAFREIKYSSILNSYSLAIPIPDLSDSGSVKLEMKESELYPNISILIRVSPFLKFLIIKSVLLVSSFSQQK
jgi:hypothetical protein